jgi:hypothetical protein
MAKRPPAPVRIVVLLLAIVALGLTMCVRAEHPRNPGATRVPTPTIAPSANTQVPEAVPDAAPAPPPRDYFPATKAPGAFYR